MGPKTNTFDSNVVVSTLGVSPLALVIFNFLGLKDFWHFKKFVMQYITKQLHDGLLSKKEAMLKKTRIIHIRSSKFIVYNPSALHKSESRN